MKSRLASAFAVLVLTLSIILGIAVVSNAGDEVGAVKSSINLAENVTLNIEFAVPVGGVEAKITLPDGSVDYQSVKDAPKNGENSVFTAEIAIKDFAADVTVAILDKDGNELASDTASASAYCEKYEETYANGMFSDLVSALEEYAIAAKYYFSDEIEAEESEVTDLSGVADAVATGELPAGIIHRSATLLLETETVIRHYFELGEGRSIDEYTVYVDKNSNGIPDEDELLVAKEKSGVYYFDVVGISPNELSTPAVITVENGDNDYCFEYGALTYLKRISKKTNSNDVKNLIRALYNYSKAADSLSVTVTFETNGGDAVEPLIYKYGSTALINAESTKEAFDLVGWYVDEALTIPITEAPAKPLDNFTVYAKWARKTYDITFSVNGVEHVVKTSSGEIPAFTGDTSKPATQTVSYSFIGWDKELAPATENTTYVAQYSSSTRKYTVSYVVEGKTVGSDLLEYNAVPTPPAKHGGQSILWFDVKAIQTDTTLTGYYTKLDPDMASWAMEAPLLSYSTTSNYENSGSMVKSSSALLYLALGEHENPNVTIRDRILQHLRSLIAPGHEPGFNAGPFWHYATVSMSIMVCRYTDSVWSQLTADEKARLDLIMECYAILTTFVSDDQNSYKTGPALTGNFGKTWNPNHRMAMILPIVAATQYFSYGGADGAAYINNMLLNFDHDAYIEKFDAFGFTRAKYNWTTEGRTLDNGTIAPGAKQLMMNGGDAYICHQDSGSISNGIEIGTSAGSGVGVRTEYTYGGATLYQLDLILEKLYSYNYAGGLVISDTSGFSNGVDPNTKKPYAYIVDGTKSPFEGEDGMMKEFISSDAGGIRSSTSYCTHDFMLVVQSFAAMTTIGAYEIDVTDPLYRQMWVGNGDLMYKNEHGYNSYSIGKDRGQAFDKDHLEYLPWKAWWQEHHGDAFTLTRSISYTLNGGYAGGLVTSYAQSEQEQSFTLPTPTHKLGTFVGWFLDADGKVTSVEGVRIADGKLTVEKNYFKHISLYAIFTLPDGINVGEIKYVIPSGATLTGTYDSVYYFDGTDEQISLPTLSLEDGYSFIGWYRDYKFATDKLSGSYTIPKSDMQDSATVIFYARVEKTIFSQTEGYPLDPSTIPTTKTVIINGETLPSLSQTVCDDGSIMFTKLKDDRADKNSDGYWRQENLKMNSGALTVSMTIYKDGVLPFVSSSFRIRASANTTDFVVISSNGTVKLLGKTMGTITEEASTFTFILYANRDQNGNFVDGYTIDGYLDGELVFSGLEYNIALSATNATIFHWYFGVSAEGSMHVKDLSFTDGVVIPE